MSDNNINENSSNNDNENISMEISPLKNVSFEDEKKLEEFVENHINKSKEYDLEKKKENNQSNIPNQSNNQGLTLENLLNIKTIVEAAVQRNAFSKEEMKDVLINYEIFVKGLQNLVNTVQKN